MSDFMFGWPYAAKAAIQHEFDTDHLNVWLTFRFTMNQLVKPANSKWHVYADSVEKAVTVSAWQDAYTLLLTVPDVGSQPARVLVEYDGPGPETWAANDPNRETLEITWTKQWEPWGPILSLDITT
jgi:hypothetical protein